MIGDGTKHAVSFGCNRAGQGSTEQCVGSDWNLSGRHNLGVSARAGESVAAARADTPVFVAY